MTLDGAGTAGRLHDLDGYVDFGPAGGSYYYSRTRMAADGIITLDGETIPVTGTAWFDHQWGDFIAVGGGGWDWFAVNLADGTDLTLSLVRDADGGYPLVYGTLVDRRAAAHHLRPRHSRWRSPDAGRPRPRAPTTPRAGASSFPAEALVIELAPTVAAQELDTRATTGVVYWEGSQGRASRAGQPLSGEAYVELTGYGPGVAAE